MLPTKRNANVLSSFPSIFDDFLNRDLWNRDLLNWGVSNFSDTNTTIPATNIRENADNFEIELAAPGMNKNDFKIELEGNTLTISSEKTHQSEPNEGEKYSRREFSYQSFQRTFNLVKDVVDADGIQARYENGVLYLTIPKKEEAKQKGPRLIQIS